MKNIHAQALGRIGGRKASDLLTDEQRKARASKAGSARWANASAEEKTAHSALMRAGRKPKNP